MAAEGAPGTDDLLSVVIPVYQAEAMLPELCERLRSVLDELGGRYELILVEDGSRDASWKVLAGLAETIPHLVAVKLSRNFGQHYAITAGLDLARGDHVVVMDCDLQDPPEAIPVLLAKAREGHDVVLARRKDRKDGAVKRLGGRLYYRLFALLSGFRPDPQVGSFRVMSRGVVDAFTRMRETYRYFGAMIEWLGFDVATVDVEHAQRHSGRTTYSWRRLLRLSVDGIVSFSNRPLYLSVGLGALISLGAAGYGLTLIVRYLVTGPIQQAGWLSTITLLAFLGGLILLNLGVIGIYLGRVYDQTKARPLYVVQRIVGERTNRTPS